MVHSSVPADTDARSWTVLVEAWRSMSVIERAELTEQLCRDVEELARRRYGPELADAAYAGLV